MSNRTEILKQNPFMCGWLKAHWPSVRALDNDWTMERYDYPPEVRVWVKNNWIKVSEHNGGTYQEPHYHRKRYPTCACDFCNKKEDKEISQLTQQNTNFEPITLRKSNRYAVDITKQEPYNEIDDSKDFAKEYQKTAFAKGMDDANAKALDIMAKEGADNAAKHMMKMAGGDYARMRSMYG